MARNAFSVISVKLDASMTSEKQNYVNARRTNTQHNRKPNYPGTQVNLELSLQCRGKPGFIMPITYLCASGQHAGFH